MSTDPASPAHGTLTRRRAVNTKRIQDSIMAAQACGLTPTGITHGADGSTTIHLGAIPAPEKYKPRGWIV